MTINYQTKGTCSRSIQLTIENEIIKEVRFSGGCSGNLQGIAALVTGRNAREVLPILKGINCGGKGTSCPDQLAKAIEEII